MLQKVLFSGVVLFVTLFQYNEGYRPCIVPVKANTDEAWFIKAAAGGFHLIEHSDCDNCEKQEAWTWLRAQGRTIPRKMCWIMDITTHYGSYKLPFNCKYYDVAKEECELDFGHSDIKEKISWGGQFVMTKTDNKTFVAGTTCIFGKENFWWIMKTDKLGLPKQLMDEIKTEFTKMGFQSGNVANETTSPLYIKKLLATPANC